VIGGSELKNGMTILYNGEPYRVEYFQHVKPGKGSAFTRTKLRNLATGAVLEYTFKAREDIETALVERKEIEYLYKDPQEVHFMDPETYDQIAYPTDRCKNVIPWLKENMRVTVTLFKDKMLDIAVPNFVELKVVETDPGLRGDTAQGGSKPAKLESGGVVTVPLFINEGDVIQIDTRTGEYLNRV
jgi:elongation factor P